MLTTDILKNPLAPTACAMGLPVRSAIDRLASNGFRSVQLSATHLELRPRMLDGSARRGLLSILRRLELQLSGLDAFVPVDHWSDLAQVDRAHQAMCEMIGLASDLGRVPLSVQFPLQSDGKEPGGEGLGGQADAVRIPSEAVQAVVERADREGVLLVDHGLPPRSDIPVEFGLDCAAALASRLDPARLVHAHAPKSVRMTDLLRSGVRGPIGDRLEGQLDALNLKVALAVSGYGYPIVIDTRQWREPWEGVLRTAEHWGECLSGDRID